MKFRYFGMKAQLKEELRAHGVDKVRLDNGRLVSLASAKTSRLIQAVSALN